MNTDQIRENLVAQGLSDTIIDAMMKSMEKAAKPKSGKKGGFTRVAKNPLREVTITSKCECCGTIERSTLMCSISADSPSIQKVATSLCNNCPTVLRELTPDELIALILIKNHPARSVHFASNITQMYMAKQYTPEQVIMLKTSHF